jgi:hypothetical protein
MKTVKFSDITWYIKEGKGLGPGSNNWSSENVFVDSKGFLHLTIDKKDGKWYCAEIYSKDIVPCGEYVFFLSTNVERLDKNIVVGFFIYENDKKEIDIEFNNNISSYSVQPNKTHNFKLNLQGDYSTHGIIFYPSFLEFYSFHGHRKMPMLFPTSPFRLAHPDFKSGLIIDKWSAEYSHSANIRKGHLHINFWLKNGRPPKKESEIIIEDIGIRYGEYTIKMT